MIPPTFRQSPRDPAFVADPYPAYERLRALGPCARWAELPHLAAVFAGHADVCALLRDRRFGREVLHVATREELGWPPIPERLAPFHAFEARSLLEREPPAHTRLRRLVNRAFTSRATAALEPRIERLAHGLIDGFAGPETDLLSAYAEPIPITIIAELLGAPLEAAPQMLDWSHAMVGMYEARRDRAAEDRAVAATIAFTAFMEDLIARRRRAPGEALIDDLIAAEEAGDRLSTEELTVTAILLLNAGHEATVHAIANGARTMLERGWRDDDLAEPRAADELLRVDAPLHLFSRYALEDLDWNGLALRRGDAVGLLLGAANRDPGAFPDPARADPRRANADRHVSFGAGIHFCVGAPLARLELRTALRTLFARLPELRLARPPRAADRWHFRGVERLDVVA